MGRTAGNGRKGLLSIAGEEWRSEHVGGDGLKGGEKRGTRGQKMNNNSGRLRKEKRGCYGKARVRLNGSEGGAKKKKRHEDHGGTGSPSLGPVVNHQWNVTKNTGAWDFHEKRGTRDPLRTASFMRWGTAP